MDVCRFFRALMIITVLTLLSCGANRQLESITITPNPGTATTGGGTVQFTATGAYSDGTSAPLTEVRWSIGNPWSLAPLPCCVGLSDTGLATCQAGRSSNIPIVATAPADPAMPLGKMSPTTKNVSGSATLICQ